MRQKDIAILVGVGIVAAIISWIVAGSVFSSGKSHHVQAPVAYPISSTFPDVHNDSEYNTVFNNNALDPTQIIRVGTNQNQQPFNNSGD